LRNSWASDAAVEGKLPCDTLAQCARAFLRRAHVADERHCWRQFRCPVQQRPLRKNWNRNQLGVWRFIRRTKSIKEVPAFWRGTLNRCSAHLLNCFGTPKHKKTLNVITRGERSMKATLIAIAALSLFTVATPASAEDGWRHRDRDYGWRDHDWRRHHRSGIRVDIGRAYARGDCSVKVTKIHRPNGTVVTRRVRSCDYWCGSNAWRRKGPPRRGLFFCAGRWPLQPNYENSLRWKFADRWPRPKSSDPSRVHPDRSCGTGAKKMGRAKRPKSREETPKEGAPR